jgi:hypothetical protein
MWDRCSRAYITTIEATARKPNTSVAMLSFTVRCAERLRFSRGGSSSRSADVGCKPPLAGQLCVSYFPGEGMFVRVSKDRISSPRVEEGPQVQLTNSGPNSCQGSTVDATRFSSFVCRWSGGAAPAWIARSACMEPSAAPLSLVPTARAASLTARCRTDSRRW